MRYSAGDGMPQKIAKLSDVAEKHLLSIGAYTASFEGSIECPLRRSPRNVLSTHGFHAHVPNP